MPPDDAYRCHALEVEGAIIGYINSGCAHKVNLSDYGIKDLNGHDPDTPNLVILSVVVDPAKQGKGLSRAQMEAFVARMRARGRSTIHLICKPHHVPPL